MKTKALKVVEDLESRSIWVEALRRLKTQFGASGLKLSTEDAAMGLDQIDYWNRLCSGIVLVVVKIGGPNARNDIKQLLAMKVDGLIAPMVESLYWLENYMEAIQDYKTPKQFASLDKHINIETQVAVEQLDTILASPLAGQLDEITIGCTDLCKSMKRSIQDPYLVDCVKDCVAKIKSKGLKVSFGGGVSPMGIDARLKEIIPDKFNTRLVTFDVLAGQSYREAVRDALRLEIQTLAIDRKKGFISGEEGKFRTWELEKRLSLQD
ncbi:MAG: aldolase/citrate lyase family protein [Nitrospinota bacterium]|nr:aldolase/citrate lyase family protein [Nitrospinota bacterium]